MVPYGSSLIVAAAAVATAFGVGGCASTIALDRAVIAYDTTIADSVSKQLLLNVARARHNQPMHFTAVSNVAATYKFGVNAGIGGALTGDKGSLLVPLFGVSAEENPTISIAPMQGEEFTQRLLTPFQEQKLTLLLRQGYDVDALLRLLGAEVRLRADGSDQVAVHFNRPSDETGYAVFRRVVAHLSAIQDRHALYVEPLHFQHSWILPAAEVTPENYNSTYSHFSLLFDPKRQEVHVTRRVNGRVMITNYDPAVLPDDERRRLHAEADEAPANDVLIDIRKGYTGGEFPMRGRLRLRSFHEVLNFVGRGIAEEPEFDVPPDSRTPAVGENPMRTLDIVESIEEPPEGTLSVQWNGRYYAVRPQSGYQWNRKAFSLLYQLYQMSMSPVQAGGPAITIAK